MSPKPNIFIGCSTECYKKGIPTAIQFNLQEWADSEIWNQGFFEPSRTTIEDLESKIPSFDAAIFVFDPDDKVVSRGSEWGGIRDNLLVEFGMALAFLGRERTFFIVPKELNLKIPSDLAGMKAGTYPLESLNLNSALHLSIDSIRKAMNRPKNITNYQIKPNITLEYIRHPHHLGLSSLLEEKIRNTFSTGIIRNNWIIDLKYDFTLLKKNIITEKIIWSFDMINVSNSTIKKEISLDYYSDDRNSLEAYSITNAQGKKQSLIPPETETIIGKNLRITKSHVLEPGSTHTVYMQFRQNYTVWKEKPQIINCFASKDPVRNVVIRVHVPQGYRMDVLGVEPIPPDTMDDTHDFQITDMLLPEQVIEYIFEKEN